MGEVRLHELPKKDVVLALLEQGLTMVHLDPRRPEVDVPQSFKSDPVLRLNLSYRFGIPDFEVGDDGIVCTLHFSRDGDHRCVIPWSALFGATSQVSQDGRMWMESMPVEMRVDLARRSVVLLSQVNTAGAIVPLADGGADTAEVSPEPASEPEPALRVIDGGVEDEAPAGDEPPRPSKKTRGHLRLVK